MSKGKNRRPGMPGAPRAPLDFPCGREYFPLAFQPSPLSKNLVSAVRRCPSLKKFIGSLLVLTLLTLRLGAFGQEAFFEPIQSYLSKVVSISESDDLGKTGFFKPKRAFADALTLPDLTPVCRISPPLEEIFQDREPRLCCPLVPRDIFIPPESARLA